ncbi:aminotransferase class III-fold pyridoxal phosphate-dependent enzyme [Streptomyces sp. NA02950]|uniref:aspartate aminotransferase family protein n=1 Tax=Streptomyces sp. NA02950 TaxID=2742137 RepID=UPI00159159E4|nr:aminotransferase class III-fold pyridoxal phosphate-dependent enzyme [Streptomyces sp. NA02950]QKV90699.1 aminotransferase class III-fold pyridoxal phosphate-dependent enzyme [Streptomyces sp. NA02950]
MAQLSPVLKQAVPIVATRGEGMYLFDADDRRFLDFTAGVGVTSTGHCHPRVVEAAQAQVAKLIHGQYTTVRHEPLLALTERLGTVLPANLDALFYVNSGSEAVEAALRLARHATGRQNAVVFSGSFHGRTMGAAALTTAGTRFRAGIGPLMPGVAVAPFPHAFRLGMTQEQAVAFALRELDTVLASESAPEETAAFFVEPVLGEGGYVPAPPAFLAGLRERADRHGILLVLDEIQTGVGRTGRFWAHEHSPGTTPDVLVTAKGLASGFPLSAIAASATVMERAWPGSQGGTYGGNAVSCAAALATLDVIEDNKLVDNAARQGSRLVEGLRGVAAEHSAIADVRGLGLMAASEFCHPDGSPDPATARSAQQAAAELGLVVLTCGVHSNVVRMMPALIVTAGQIDDAVAVWSRAVAQALRATRAGGHE